MSRRPIPTPAFSRREFLAAGITAPSLAAIPPRSPDPISLGTRRELFVDDFLIERIAGARLEMYPPRAEESVLTFDKPWEGIYSAYATVIKDRELYRMYYRGLPVARHDLDSEVTCIAESADGKQWEKPNIGLFEVQGTRDNNVILARHRGCHNFAPFLDTNPRTPPDQRYKALGGTGEPGLIAFASPDGIRWRELQQAPVITKGAFDSQNVAFWSHSEGQYVCYFRVFVDGFRWIARATSPDFLHWSEPEELETDGKPRQHLYTNQLLPYAVAPHIYIGQPTRFFPGRRALSPEQLRRLNTPADWGYANDCADIVLVTARGDKELKRTFMEAYIRPGLDPRNWTSRANYTVYGLVQTSDQEMTLYVEHNLGYPTAHVRRYTLRVDGFASVRAPYAGGEMVTRPFSFAGRSLLLNFATSAAGGIRVEVQDGAGTPLPGFTLADCPEIIGDDVQRVARWKDTDDLSTLAGKPIRLRFALNDADLYSLRFA